MLGNYSPGVRGTRSGTGSSSGWLAVIIGIPVVLAMIVLAFGCVLVGPVVILLAIRELFHATTRILASGIAPPDELVGPLLIAALVGALIGWIRRGLHVKHKFGESLFSSLFTPKWFGSRPIMAVADVFLHAFVGYLIALVIGYSVVENPLLEGIDISPIGIVYVIAGGGAGGGAGGDLNIFSALIALVAVILIGLIAGSVISALAESAFVWAVANLVTLGAGKGAVKEAMAELVEKGDLEKDHIGLAAIKGAILGVLIGIILMAYPL